MTQTSEPAAPPQETRANATPMLSVVVPAFNEAENIPLLYRRVADALQALVPGQWDLIFSDDGSRDATWSVISRLAADDPRVKGVRLSRNFGHQYALLAGLEMAAGQA